MLDKLKPGALMNDIDESEIIDHYDGVKTK